MIFVTVGTNEAPFDRLLEMVDRARFEDEVVVQNGSSTVRPKDARCIDFLSFQDLREHVNRARVVVSHAGVGSILLSLMNGKQPVVVPRLRRHGEHVDDHQLAFARRLQSKGLVSVVEQPDELRTAVEAAQQLAPPKLGGALARDLHRYLVTYAAPTDQSERSP
jgi:exopolysaccharide biosynthesis glucuronosyltransferase PssE